MKAENLCPWHNTGKPTWAPTRFYVAGCAACERKLAAGKCAVTDPTPSQLFERRSVGQDHRPLTKAEKAKRRRWQIEAMARARRLAT